MIPSTAIQQINVAVSRPRGFLTMPICLIASDVSSLLFSVAISLAFKAAGQGVPDWQPYVRLLPLLFVFVAVYALAGLYSGISITPPEELQRWRWPRSPFAARANRSPAPPWVRWRSALCCCRCAGH